MRLHWQRPSSGRTTTSFQLLAACLLVATLAGCASPRNKAPVEDRQSTPVRTAGSPVTPTEADKPPPPGIENAGKPGYYTVKPGDTLIRIALESGQNWRDIAAWNGLDNPNLIEVGQVVRIVPPVSSDGGGAVAARPVSTPRIEARGLDNKPVPAGKAASSTSASSTGAGAASPRRTTSPGRSSGPSPASTTRPNTNTRRNSTFSPR